MRPSPAHHTRRPDDARLGLRGREFGPFHEGAPRHDVSTRGDLERQGGEPRDRVGRRGARGRRRRPLPASPAPRARLAGEGVRRRRRRRWHLVVEPLPGRTLRFRGLHLPVPLRREALQGLELEPEVPGAAGDRAVDALHHRPARSAQGHPVRHEDHLRALRRGPRPLDSCTPTRATSSTPSSSSPAPGCSPHRCRTSRASSRSAGSSCSRRPIPPRAWTWRASASASSGSARPVSRSSRRSRPRSGT